MHRIERQTVEFEVDREHSARVQDELTRLCQYRFASVIERECDRVIASRDENTVLRIPRLEIDLGEIDLDQPLEAQVVSAFEFELRNGLNEWCAESTETLPENSLTPPPDHLEHGQIALPQKLDPPDLFEILMCFLETGRLAESSDTPIDAPLASGNPSRVLGELIEKGFTAEQRSQIQILLARTLISVERLVNEFPESLLKSLAEELAPRSFEADKTRISGDSSAPLPIEESARAEKDHVHWRSFFRRLSHYDPSDLDRSASRLPTEKRPPSNSSQPNSRETRHRPLPGRDPNSEPTQESPNQPPLFIHPEQPVAEDSTWHVENAGLVLLWPFLPPLFQNLELIGAERQFHDDMTRVQAILALQYLATGETETSLPSLPLNRVLCGVPPGAVHSIDWEPDTDFANACDELLKSATSHGSIWGAISVTGFRSAWLQREGTLSFENQQYLLKVEPRPFDLLLSRLPWPVSVIKLPWLREPIQIDWTRP